MVVKHERSAEGIRDSLVRLVEFFSGLDVHCADSSVLSGMESDLIRMESQLKMYCGYGYKGVKDVQNRLGAPAPGTQVVDPGA